MQILTQGGGFFVAENGVNSNVASPLCVRICVRNLQYLKFPEGYICPYPEQLPFFLTIISSKQEKNCVLIFLF